MKFRMLPMVVVLGMMGVFLPPCLTFAQTAPAGFRLPFVGRYYITAGPSCLDNHKNELNKEAIDFGLPLRTEVLATERGTAYTFWDSYGGGNVVVVWHPNSALKSVYAHLSSEGRVANGQEVIKGQRIGYSGNSGPASTGAHLHFAVLSGSSPGPHYGGTSIWIRDMPGITWTGTQSNPYCAPPGQYDGYAVGPPVDQPNQPPNIPNPTGPGNGILTNSRTVNLTWQDTGDDGRPRSNRDFLAEVWKSDNSWRQTWGWNTATNWELRDLSDGAYQWHVKSGDGELASNWSPTWGFTIDATLPTGNIASPGDGTITNNPSFTLAADAGDNLSGVNRVEFNAHFDGSWHGAVCTATNHPYTCRWDASGVGDQTITFAMHIIDNAGNRVVDPGGYRTVNLDRTAPTGGITLPATGSATNDAHFTINADANDNLTGVKQVEFFAWYDGVWHPLCVDTDTPYTCLWDASEVDDQTIFFSTHIVDNATNVVIDPGGYRPVTLDRVAPTGSVSANYGWGIADSVGVPVTLSSSDAGSGVRHARLSNDGSTWNDWQPMRDTIQWLLRGLHGDTLTVYVQYRDAAGNVSAPASSSLTLNFYPARPASTRYRLASDAVAMNGGSQQSGRYQLNGTTGQTLASGGFASSQRYRAALGFWPQVGLEGTGPLPSPTPTSITVTPTSTSTTPTGPRSLNVFLPFVIGGGQGGAPPTADTVVTPTNTSTGTPVLPSATATSVATTATRTANTPTATGTIIVPTATSTVTLTTAPIAGQLPVVGGSGSETRAP